MERFPVLELSDNDLSTVMNGYHSKMRAFLGWDHMGNDFQGSHGSFTLREVARQER